MIMLIFLVRIQNNTTKRDIVDFISPALKGGLFAPNGVLENIEIMALRDRRTNSIEHYAIVQVKPDKASLRVIHQLNRKKLKGRPINVRQFNIRNRKNDPRLKNQYTALKSKENRLSERRCDSLEMQETIKIEGDIRYARRLGE